ncbi:MAG: GntR family transcriptional regulator [Spirochaetaceae bacterium]|nr:MAG: GntR family transcriptional regulator [Spirochaetaceae bacterium]
MEAIGKELELGTKRNGGSVTHSLSDQVYDWLSEEIIRGNIQYGDRLNIKSIASRLNVSPMPIRDALKRLEMEKLVIIKPRSTCYVRVPTKRMTLEAVAARRMLELFAVQEIYSSITTAQLGDLKRILDQMAEVLRRGVNRRTRAVIEEYIELDRQFHTEICALARNEYVNRFYRETSMHLNMSFRYGVGVCHGLEATYRDHQQIYNHLEANSAEAIAVLEEHLLHSRQNILNEPTFQLLED